MVTTYSRLVDDQSLLKKLKCERIDIGRKNSPFRCTTFSLPSHFFLTSFDVYLSESDHYHYQL